MLFWVFACCGISVAFMDRDLPPVLPFFSFLLF